MREGVPLHETELLREIAETINRAFDMEPMLNDVLAKLLELTGLTAAWVFLIEDRASTDYRCAADACLPQALRRDEKRPMREGDCWCIDKYRDGRLSRAVNIMNCKRLEDAIRFRRGDTGGLTHHASIPLRAGEELFGILNVAAPGKTDFAEDELALLQSVALQIGTAAHRIRLFDRERKRAMLFERLGAAARQLRASTDDGRIAADIVRIAGDTIGWSNVALWMQEQQGLYLHAAYDRGSIVAPSGGDAVRRCDVLSGVLSEQAATLLQPPIERGLLPGDAAPRSAAAVPLLLQGRPIGVLVAGSDSPDAPFDAVDAEVLEALSSHAALTYETARLQEQSRTLARWEERNRIARDLHDSVSQMLFSLQLHARGLEAVLRDAPEGARKGAAEIGRLSREALTEMRGMIRQLRPTGLEEGLLTGLARYGASIGLSVACDAGELRQLPEYVETALWRIGQEALNNVRKHAGVERAEVALAFERDEAVMTVVDRGAGFHERRERLATASECGIGLATMRERAESLGGRVDISSAPGEGTRIVARVPLPERKEGGEAS